MFPLFNSLSKYSLSSFVKYLLSAFSIILFNDSSLNFVDVAKLIFNNSDVFSSSVNSLSPLDNSFPLKSTSSCFPVNISFNISLKLLSTDLSAFSKKLTLTSIYVGIALALSPIEFILPIIACFLLSKLASNPPQSILFTADNCELIEFDSDATQFFADANCSVFTFIIHNSPYFLL